MCTESEVDKKNALGATHSVVVLYVAILFGCYVGRYPPAASARSREWNE